MLEKTEKGHETASQQRWTGRWRVFSQHTTLSAPVSVVIHTPQGALVSTHGVQRSADGADKCDPPYSLPGMVVQPEKWYAVSAKNAQCALAILCVRHVATVL